LQLLDGFTPDKDLTSSGPLLIPGTRLLVRGGKTGELHVLNSALGIVALAIIGGCATRAPQLSASELLGQGQLSLRQTDLGLTPLTALLGTLAVQEEMQLQFPIVARVP
jgi:hypothetical protein